MRIAIVEDEVKEAEFLKKCIHKWIEENKFEYADKTDVVVFNNGVDFLTGYKSIYDIVFMDVEMPFIDGVRSAKKLREMDSDVTLIFVTRMSQYAITGYEVAAFDYVLKPINYSRFSSMMKRLLRNRRIKNSSATLAVKTQYGLKMIPFNRIEYVEAVGHKIYVHADEVVLTYTSLSDLEKRFPEDAFVRVSSGFIVNLAFVTRVGKNSQIFIGDYPIVMSRTKKQIVLTKLAAYLGGNK